MKKPMVSNPTVYSTL